VGDAIEAASAGDTIAICPGTFPVSQGIFINKGLTIGGAGPGTDPGKNTILQGAVTDEALLTISGQVVIQNLRLTGGTGFDGGALFNTSGSLELINCAFSENGTPISWGR
jgi:hypothetical protein